MRKRFAKTFSVCTGLMLAGLLTVTSMNMQSVNAAEDSGAVGLNVAYHSQQEILDRMNSDAAVTSASLTFAAVPSTAQPYAAGSLSSETLDGAITMLNQIRFIAGLQDNVTLDDSYNQMAQAASLVNYVNNELTHFPEQPAGMEDSLYEQGRNGAASSNIAWASWATQKFKDSLINGWMADYDDSNVERLGHRRWCLNPQMGKTGFGAVAGDNGTYSAMYSFDVSNSGAAQTGVAWPAQNMPMEYFDDAYPWSLSVGSEVDKNNVSVTLTKVSDGSTWKFSSGSADGYFNVDNGGYGQVGCIIFRPANVHYSAGDSFRVSIEGLGAPLSYTVNFFDETTCGGNENPGEGETPDEGGNPGEGETPDEGGNPGEGETPDEGGNPGEGEIPDEGGNPGEGEIPDEGGNPGEDNTPDGSNSVSGNNGNDSAPSVSGVGTMIANAQNGDVVKVIGVTALSNADMKELLKKSNVTLVMEFTYKEVNYVISIPSSAAVDDDIPWYGPLYLAAQYSNAVPPANVTTGSTYTVQANDTMAKIAKLNGMTLGQLAAKNPQIKNLNKIKVGEQIIVK